MMFEPAPFPGTIPSNIPVLGGVHAAGFTEGPADSAHQALAYHIYSCGFADTKCTDKGETENIDCPTCDKFASDAVKQRQTDSERLGGGVFMTEFGSCPDNENCYAEIDRVTSQADTAFHSWAWWQFKYFEDITSISGDVESFYAHNGSFAAEESCGPFTDLCTKDQWCAASSALRQELKQNHRCFPFAVHLKRRFL